jgi:hypothetical protein
VRWRWRIVLFVSAMLAATLTWLLAPRPARRERLIEAMWEEERATDLRPTHAEPPLPGSFGELLEPHLAGLHESFDAYAHLGAGGRDAVANVLGGRAPVAGLMPELLEDLALHRRAMQDALRATHAQSARGPASLRLFGTMRPSSHVPEAVHAGRLAALDLLILLDQGRNDEAADECADALALGRDLSYTSAVGRNTGVTVTTLVSPACARALSLASAAALERVRGQLLRIRLATPRFARILQRERLFGQLALVDVDPRMPESGRIAIADRQGRPARFDRLRLLAFRETAWAPLEDRMSAMIAAQRLDWPSCLDRTAEAMRTPAGWPARWNPLLRVADADADAFPWLLRRHRDGLLKVDAMLCLASASLVRARKGFLPRNVAAICPPPEPEATCGEQSAPLRILSNAQGARVSVKLSDGTEYSLPLTKRPPEPTHHRATGSKKRARRSRRAK